jgi:hypothetical protein
MINWIDSSSFEMDGYKITLDWAHGGSKRLSSDRDFTMMKDREFLHQYTDPANTGIENTLEVGVYQGGSVAALVHHCRKYSIASIYCQQDTKSPRLQRVGPGLCTSKFF